MEIRQISIDQCDPAELPKGYLEVVQEMRKRFSYLEISFYPHNDSMQIILPRDGRGRTQAVSIAAGDFSDLSEPEAGHELADAARQIIPSTINRLPEISDEEWEDFAELKLIYGDGDEVF